jgi:hypothetical protein
MDTEAVEADETCVIVGRKLGPGSRSNKGFNEMMESDWAGDVPRSYRRKSQVSAHWLRTIARESVGYGFVSR